MDSPYNSYSNNSYNDDYSQEEDRPSPRRGSRARSVSGSRSPRRGSASPSWLNQTSIADFYKPVREPTPEERQRTALLNEAMTSKIGPPFFLSHLKTEVPLPKELYNEPFSFYDNGFRPEIVTVRSRFLFQIINSVPVCTVGSFKIKGSVSQVSTPQAKSRSIVSVLSVYDTYGLEVTYAYLKHLYGHKYNQDAPSWLATYLEGSLVAIMPSYEIATEDEPTAVLYYSLLIFTELQRIDREKFRPLRSLEPSSVLPDEILARVIGSKRVSKDLAAAVASDRCTSVPTLDELEAVHNYQQVRDERVVQTSDGIYVAANQGLERQDNTFYLSKRPIQGPSPYADYEVANYPLEDYITVFEQRGCKKVSAIIVRMLEGVLRDITPLTELNIDLVCSWFLTLNIYQGLVLPKNEQDVTTLSAQELWNITRDLLSKAIQFYREN